MPKREQNNTIRKVQEYLREIKSQTGCQVCGESNPLALDFHHKPDEQKELNLSEARTWRKAQNEMKKCIVMCANCHRKSHGFLKTNPQRVEKQIKLF